MEFRVFYHEQTDEEKSGTAQFEGNSLSAIVDAQTVQEAFEISQRSLSDIAKIDGIIPLA